ncbi:MAG: nucleotide exchange factor GrpE [Lachnospiraceae bacterium]|nr:nucleotide exchange factor GrpE [Lachnospiraceae bacterium]
MDTEEKKSSEEMEEAVRKAVADAHERSAESINDADCDGQEAVADQAEGQAADINAEAGQGANAETESGEDAARESEDGTDAEDAAEAEGGQEDGAEEGKESDKMDIFGRRSKIELEKKEEQIKKLSDQFMRLMAEFDNFRKRTEKEKSGMYAMGAKDVIEKILPVLDNFERGLALVGEENKDDPFAAGMEKIYKQFVTVLTDLGVTPIDAAGKEFDPNLHNAVMHVDDDSVGDNIVVEELQKGYMYKDSVVRHSMVKVAN